MLMGGDSKFFGWGGQPLMGGDYPTLPNQNGIFAAHIEFIYCLSTSLLTSHPPIFQTLSRLHLYCIQTSSIFHQTATRLNLNFIEIYLKFILAFQSSSWVYLKLIFFFANATWNSKTFSLLQEGQEKVIECSNHVKKEIKTSLGQLCQAQAQIQLEIGLVRFNLR